MLADFSFCESIADIGGFSGDPLGGGGGHVNGWMGRKSAVGVKQYKD
jgi:hypothetical protein